MDAPHAAPAYPETEFLLNDEYVFENFIVGPSNRLAHAAALAVAEAPGRAYNPLFVHGGVGLGKTHLLQAVCHTVKARSASPRFLYLSCETFVNRFIQAVQRQELEAFRNRYRHVDMLLIDDIHFLANKDRTQEEFFHTFNTLYHAQKQIIISSDSPPKEIPTLEERLVSRFKWGLVAQLELPHFETRFALVTQKARLRGHELPNEVADLIATHIQTNVRELEGAVIKVLGYASLAGRPIDMDLAQEALGESLVSPPVRRVVMSDIQEAVVRRFHVRLSDLQSKKRSKSIVRPRQICMFLARRLTPLSLEEIGGHFGGRDHSTVLYGIEKIEEMVRSDPAFRTLLEELTREVTGQGAQV